MGAENMVITLQDDIYPWRLERWAQGKFMAFPPFRELCHVLDVEALPPV